ncbi:hypothetical protein GDO81_005321 [Engystomops pustulosus]|uniref:Uncharacterized protein n=1 Tax=Engystomops pustulosus TaxID=76066 RepID=A0AAV7CMF6_ENGPU|nr:hypothetical protein GDO81_005321 [Engystomops pustulosus]
MLVWCTKEPMGPSNTHVYKLPGCFCSVYFPDSSPPDLQTVLQRNIGVSRFKNVCFEIVEKTSTGIGNGQNTSLSGLPSFVNGLFLHRLL